MSKNFELLRKTESSVLRPKSDVARPELIPAGMHARPSPVNSNGHSSDLSGFLRILHRHWRLSAISAGVIFAAVAIGTFLMRPVYEPAARIEVDPPGSETFSLERADVRDPEWVDTQVENLESADLAISTIRQLRLDKNRDFAANTKAESTQAPAQDETGVSLTPAENAALRTFKDRLDVSRKMKGNLITVSVAAHDPALAALVTNTLISTYIDKYYKARYDAVMQSSEWLSRQLDDIRDKVRLSNQALAAFQKSTGIADIDDKQSTVMQSLLELNRQLAQAQGDRIQTEAYLGRAAAGNTDSLPQIHDNPVIQSLTRDLNETDAELAQVRVSYGNQHPRVKTLRKKVEELQRELAAQKQTVVAQLKTSYAAAQSRERLLVGQLRDITGDMSQAAQYNALKKEAQANSDLYNALFARVKEAGIAAASRSSNIRVVDKAQILDEPTRPRRWLNLAIGLVLGLIGGVMVSFAKEAMDTTIHSPDDVRKWTGLPALSIMPIFASRHDELSGGEKFLLERPNSREAEAVRVLYTSIMLSQPSALPRTLLVGSPSPRDGKTTIAINLALALARHGSTCIVDADLRRKALSASFDAQSHVGVAEVITGAASLDEALVSVPEACGLSLLPAGTPPANAAEIMISAQMRDLMHVLRGRFQSVVIDSPPFLAYADARALATLTDGVILVSRCGSTTREALNRVAELLAEVRAPLLGVVLNGADLKGPDYSYYGYDEAEKSA